MITQAYAFVALLFAVAAILKFLDVYGRWKIFQYLPAIVVLYFVVMLLSTFGVWQQTPEINQAYKSLKLHILPAMIFLMLLNADLRKIRQLGGRMLMAFFAASISIGIAFVVGFTLFQSFLLPGAWKTLAALSGSWMGGMGNMAAVQMALDVPDSSMGYTLLIDSIDYALWVMLLLALVPYAKKFADWTGADTSVLDEVGSKLSSESQVHKGDLTTPLLLLLASSLVVSIVSINIAGLLPTSAFFTQTTWTVLIVTVVGVLAAMTPMSKLFGATELSTLMLYLIIALIASRADIAELAAAPTYILLGLVILALHGVMMVVFAKLFKFDLFTCGVASLANIGGVASAPILAAAYSRALIPIGVLMALLGYVIGTGGGLIVGKILSVIAIG
ncbi:DUF819 domain-containing protein [Neptunicella marina]|uniref:DUF819 family protein n=1 Tax=Neptunicella marina TaxID=2125989 RepID=A0A8J6IRW0_9ALTE|nr:DUF819 family protein [Neptunicella marina]MBC3765646.1 DUF819 family protein [Neptunicella marina]